MRNGRDDHMRQEWGKSRVIMKASTCETPHYFMLGLVINFIILVEPPMPESGVTKYIALPLG